MAKIFLSVPMADASELKMMRSLYDAILSCREHQVRIYFNGNDNLISRVRNNHISVFLNEYDDCDYFVSINPDLEIVNAFSTNNIFSKLISHDKDFVGGLYASNEGGTIPICTSTPYDSNLSKTNIPFDSGLLRMKWLSAGCWCLKRSAIEEMASSYPELTSEGEGDVVGLKIYGLYIPQIFTVDEGGQDKKRYLPEDFSFCERWSNLNKEIFADTSIALRRLSISSHSLWDLEIIKQEETKTPTVDKEDNSGTKIENKKINSNIFKSGILAEDVPPPGFDLIPEELREGVSL